MSANHGKYRRLDDLIGRHQAPREAEPAWLSPAQPTASPTPPKPEGRAERLAAATERLERLSEEEAIAAGRMDCLNEELKRLLDGGPLTEDRKQETWTCVRQQEATAREQGMLDAELHDLEHEYWELGLRMPSPRDGGALRLLRALTARRA